MALCAGCSATTPEGERCPICGEDPTLVNKGPSSSGERYRLDRILGRGPGRNTYQGTRIRDGQRVVLKESRLPRRADVKVRELVEREARMLQTLLHPQIPRFVEHWIAEGERGCEPLAWLVLEYVDGTDLERWLTLRPFEEAEVIRVMLELCEVLGYLHRHDPPILHRDLKPANVVRSPDGQLFLVDFGAARDGISKLGATTVVGTYGYMAPEQRNGDATERSDLYGLGTLTVGLLTGKDLASLLGPELGIEWHGHATVSPGLGALLDELLSFDPRDRPPSIEEVRRRLVALPRPRPRRPSWPLAVALSLSSVLLTLAVGMAGLAAVAILQFRGSLW